MIKAYWPFSSFEMFVGVVVSAIMSFRSRLVSQVPAHDSWKAEQRSEFEMCRLFEMRDDGKYYLIS